jgi:hypothetical protein
MTIKPRVPNTKTIRKTTKKIWNRNLKGSILYIIENSNQEKKEDFQEVIMNVNDYPF